MNKGNSAMTSVNSKKVPALFTLAAKEGLIAPGFTVFDYGCGRWPEVAESYVKGLGCMLYAAWDPNWRPSTARQLLMRYDVVCMSNVLNVIEGLDRRCDAIEHAWSLVREGGRLLVTVYEADGSGASGPSKPGCWQERRKLESYVSDELASAGVTGRIACGGKLFVSDPKGADGNLGANHYCDDEVEMICLDGLCMWVGANWTGKTVSRSFDDNMFSEWDMLDMFRDLLDPEEDPKPRLELFARWLIRTGAERQTVLDWPGFEKMGEVNI